MAYTSDLTDEQWTLLGSVFDTPGKRESKPAPDLRRVVDAMLYVSHTGCQWRFLPESFGSCRRVSPLVTQRHLARALTVLHAAARGLRPALEATWRASDPLLETAGSKIYDGGMSHDSSLFGDDPPAPTEPPPDLGDAIADWQVELLRRALDASGIADIAERQKLIERLADRQVDSLRQLRSSEARVVLEQLQSLATSAVASRPGSSWDDRDEDTWIDKL